MWLYWELWDIIQREEEEQEEEEQEEEEQEEEQEEEEARQDVREAESWFTNIQTGLKPVRHCSVKKAGLVFFIKNQH